MLTTAFAQGTHAARPAPAAANQGYYYLETDTNGGTLFQSTGTAWVQLAGPVGGMVDPMTAQDDLIVGGAAGAPARLAKGAGGQVLTVDAASGHLAWETPASVVPSKWLTLPAGWNDTWSAAKAAAGTTPAWVAFIGDSITQGYQSSDWLAKSWPGKLRASLLGASAPYADYYPSCDSQDFAMSNSGVSFAGTPPWTVASATRTWYPNGYNQNPLWTATGIANQASFTTPYACTALDILYLDYAAGTWQYAVDGGAPVTVTCTGNGTIPVAQIKRIGLTGLANTTHTVAFGQQSAADVLIPLGIATYGGATGLGFARLGYLNGQMEDYVSSANIPADRVRLWQGVEPQGDAAATSATGFGFPTQPHLAIVALGINDCAHAQTIADFQLGLARFVRALRRGRANASVVFLVNSNPDTVDSDMTSGQFGNAYNWHNFVAAIQQVGAAYNCAVANIGAKWGELGVTDGYQTATNAHPTDAGHADIATLLASVL